MRTRTIERSLQLLDEREGGALRERLRDQLIDCRIWSTQLRKHAQAAEDGLQAISPSRHAVCPYRPVLNGRQWTDDEVIEVASLKELRRRILHVKPRYRTPAMQKFLRLYNERATRYNVHRFERLTRSQYLSQFEALQAADLEIDRAYNRIEWDNLSLLERCRLVLLHNYAYARERTFALYGANYLTVRVRRQDGVYTIQ